jgi:hypothetical protein
MKRPGHTPPFRGPHGEAVADSIVSRTYSATTRDIRGGAGLDRRVRRRLAPTRGETSGVAGAESLPHRQGDAP